MEKIVFEIRENVSAVLAQAIASTEDMTPVMGEAARFMAAESKFNFRQQASPLGVPWKQSQRAAQEGGLTLVLSGDLFGSIKEDWGSDFAAAGPEASGGAAIYAKIHQLGGTIKASAGKSLNTPFGPRGSVTIPARPYLGYNERMGAGLRTIFLDQIQRVFAGSFLGDGGAAAGGAS